MLENGFVKLPRCIISRKWFGDKNTLQLYVTLLLKAVFRESEFEGVKLKPGQLITSISKLMEATSLTERQTKTALKHLKESGDIAMQSTTKFSIITLNFHFDEQSGVLSDVRQDVRQSVRQNVYISRKKKEEGIEESTEEGREEGGASPLLPASSLSGVDNSVSSVSPVSNEELDLTGFKARLIKEYGVDPVERYEAKFRAWSSSKNAANVPMYPTIAKWLAADASPQALSLPQTAAPPAPKPQKHTDTERLKAAVLASYKRA